MLRRDGSTIIRPDSGYCQEKRLTRGKRYVKVSDMTVKQALKGISQAELARRTDLSKGAVSLLLHGHRRGTIVTLRKLAAVLEVGLDDLDAYLQKFPAPAKRSVRDVQKLFQDIQEPKKHQKTGKIRESVAA